MNSFTYYQDKCYAGNFFCYEIVTFIERFFFFILEYNLNSLRRGFGHLRDIRYETMELGKPSMIVHSSDLPKKENDIFTSTNLVMKELNKMEIRKRFAIVHTKKYIYIIGGA